MTTVAVIGAGAWGTAIAKLLCEGGHEVWLWAYEAEVVNAIRERRENVPFLPGVTLPPTLRASNEIGEVVEGRHLVVSASPSHVVREVITRAAPFLAAGTTIVSASKGVEEGTFKTMTDVIEEAAAPTSGLRVAALSGPSFAQEVARREPTAVTVAARDPQTAEWVQSVFATPYFRVYTSLDLVGVQLGGAVKNIIAVAAGVSDGLGFGYNARAALITRGLAEMTRLAVKLGAEPLTLAGLSGLGDLVLTCTGDLSRNRTVGLRLGRGEPLDAVLGSMRAVAEGVKNTRSVHELAARLGVDMPITNQMFEVLYRGKAPRQAVTDLMSRTQKPEIY